MNTKAWTSPMICTFSTLAHRREPIIVHKIYTQILNTQYCHSFIHSCSWFKNLMFYNVTLISMSILTTLYVSRACTRTSILLLCAWRAIRSAVSWAVPVWLPYRSSSVWLDILSHHASLRLDERINEKSSGEKSTGLFSTTHYYTLQSGREVCFQKCKHKLNHWI